MSLALPTVIGRPNRARMYARPLRTSRGAHGAPASTTRGTGRSPRRAPQHWRTVLRRPPRGAITESDVAHRNSPRVVAASASQSSSRSDSSSPPVATGRHWDTDLSAAGTIRSRRQSGSATSARCRKRGARTRAAPLLRSSPTVSPTCRARVRSAPTARTEGRDARGLHVFVSPAGPRRMRARRRRRSRTTCCTCRQAAN